MNISSADLDFTVYHCGSAWAPRMGLRILHKPTGIVVESSSRRTLHANRSAAWELLIAELEAHTDHLRQLELF